MTSLCPSKVSSRLNELISCPKLFSLVLQILIIPSFPDETNLSGWVGIVAHTIEETPNGWAEITAEFQLSSKINYYNLYIHVLKYYHHMMHIIELNHILQDKRKYY